ncbi:MAG: hypothetical protein GYB67_15075, partial [Chloroflexi bacterium]|nr:hypothetical protein [Chloroflexota bacterium]
MRRRYLVFLITAALLLLSYGALQIGAAQPNLGETCPALVAEALDTVGQRCAAVNRNEACYGFNQVRASFIESVTAPRFTAPGDLTNLTNLNSISPQPLNAAVNEWGVAVLNLQANLPNTLPGQGVIFMLLGDTS